MEGSIEELAKYRFESANEALEDAKIMFSNKRYKNTLNRAYYAIFHSIRAVNALKGFDSSKHSGVIAFFNKNFVKTEIFNKELSKIIKLASEKREEADYLDFFVASRSEAEKQIMRAQKLLDEIEKYLIDENVL